MIIITDINKVAINYKKPNQKFINKLKLKEKLKDPYFKELYELEEQKLKIVKRIIEYRVKNKTSQKQFAEREEY